MAIVESPIPRIWIAQESDLDSVAKLLEEFRDHLGATSPSFETIREGVGRIYTGGDGEYLLAAHDDGADPVGVVQTALSLVRLDGFS